MEKTTAEIDDAKNQPHRRSWTVVGFAAVIVLAMLLRSRIASIPLERDEGEYGYVAQRWLAGEVPYRSAFDQKPPGVFAAYATILSIFGTSPEAIHWGTQVFTLGTLGLIYLVGRRLFGRLAGFAAALLAAYMTSDRCVFGNASNTELFMILPLTAGLLASLKSVERSSLTFAAIAGACGTLAILCKQVALPNVIFDGLFLLTAPRQRLRLLVTYCVVALATLLPVFSYFARVAALEEFLDCAFLHNLAYAQQLPFRLYPKFFLGTFSVIALQWLPILLLAWAGFRGDEPNQRRTGRFALLWLGVSLAGVAIGGYFREHYFIQIIPPLAVLAGQGAVAIGRRWAPARPAAAIGIVAGAISYGILVMPYYWLIGTPTEKSRLLYDVAPFPEAIPVGAFLDQHAALDDTIFVYGSEPEILYYSGRRTACRYIYVYPLLTPAPGVLDRQKVALDELIANRPRFIVVHRDVRPHYFGSEAPPTFFKDELAKLLANDYRLVGVAGPRDAAVHPFSGDVPPAQLMNLPGEQTLAVWRRREP